MKKVFFSAVALVAFSFAGMANNEGKKEKKEKKVKSVEVVKPDCRTVRSIAYLQAISDGFSNEDASGMSYSIYFNCLGWAL